MTLRERVLVQILTVNKSVCWFGKSLYASVIVKVRKELFGIFISF